MEKEGSEDGNNMGPLSLWDMIGETFSKFNKISSHSLKSELVLVPISKSIKLNCLKPL